MERWRGYRGRNSFRGLADRTLEELAKCHLRRSLKTIYAGSHALCGMADSKGGMKFSPVVFEEYRNEGFTVTA